nr:capsid protein [Aspergillus cibarius chrysovirus 1]
MSTPTKTLINSSRANELLNKVRARGPAHLAAVKQFGGTEQLEPRKNAWSQVRAETLSLRTLDGCYNYLNRTYPLGQSSLAGNELEILYNIHCDLTRDVFRSQNVMGVRVKMEWELVEAQCNLYPGGMDEVLLKPEVRALIEGSVWDRTLVNKGTGFVKRDTDAVSGDNGAQIINNFRAATRGQDKLTRLIKGCLLWMDLADKGSQVYSHMMATAEYNPNTIAQLQDNTAYVWSDQPSDDVYNSFIYAMCQEYPHPQYGGDAPVRIPADADDVVLMCSGAAQQVVKPTMTSRLAYSSLCVYAQTFRLTHHLEHAMCIAASLRENRYTTVFGLPKVQSLVDAVYPICVFKRGETFNRLAPTMDMLRVFGRVHQCNMLLLLKDGISSAYNSSEVTPTVEMIVNAVKGAAPLLEQMNPGAVALQRLTAQMRVVDYITMDDVDAINDTSLFEGAWLIRKDPLVVKGGVLSRLFSGLNENIRGRGDVMTSREMLDRELKLAGLAPVNIPIGHYTIVGQNILTSEHMPLSPKSYREIVREEPRPQTVAKPPSGGTKGRTIRNKGRPKRVTDTVVDAAKQVVATPRVGQDSMAFKAQDVEDIIGTKLGITVTSPGERRVRIEPQEHTLSSPKKLGPPAIIEPEFKGETLDEKLTWYNLPQDKLMALAMKRDKCETSLRAFPTVMKNMRKSGKCDDLAILAMPPIDNKDWMEMCCDAWAGLRASWPNEDVTKLKLDPSVMALVKNVMPTRVGSWYIASPTTSAATRDQFAKANIAPEHMDYVYECVLGMPRWSEPGFDRQNELVCLGRLCRMGSTLHWRISAADVRTHSASRITHESLSWQPRKGRTGNSLSMRASQDDIDHGVLLDASLSVGAILKAFCTKSGNEILVGKLNQVLSLSREDRLAWNRLHEERN